MSSRKEAIAIGAKRYVGRPCPIGHSGERYTSDGGCVHCAANYSASPQKKTYDAAYYAKNLDRISGVNAARYSRRRAEIMAAVQAWQDENPAAVRAYKEKNKAHRRQLSLRPAPWFGELDELVMGEARRLANAREVVTGLRWHVDHVMPLRGRSVCGLHVWNNIQVIPAVVNMRKSNNAAGTANPLPWGESMQMA